MAIVTTETREGRISCVSNRDDIIQRAPPGFSAGEYAEWFALQFAGYFAMSDDMRTSAAWPTGTRLNRLEFPEFAYNTGMLPSGVGDVQASAEILFPLLPVDSISQRVKHEYDDDWPTNEPWEDHPIALIPADAWIYQVDFAFAAENHPLTWDKYVNTIGHDHPLLPQPVDLQGIAITTSGTAHPYLHEETIAITPGTVDAIAAINQSFNMWLSLTADDQGLEKVSVGQHLNLLFTSMRLYWRGIDTMAVDSWEGAGFSFGMGMAGDIERVGNLSGTLSAGMSTAATVGLIGNLDGTLSAGMSGVGDPTNDEGGVDDGIDNTGWFNADMSLDADIGAHFKIEGECTMSLSMAGMVISVQDSDGGAMGASLGFSAAIVKVGKLWNTHEDFIMSMSFAPAEIFVGGFLSGAFDGSMSLAGDVAMQIQLAGTLAASMSVSGYVARELSISGSFNASMSNSAVIGKVVDLSGVVESSLSFWAGITHLFTGAAPDDRTYRMVAECRTIYMGYRQNVIIMDTRKRN